MKNELRKLKYLVERNIKLYFKDKMIFFVSLITPLILIVLFLTFLDKTYESSLLAFVPEGVTLDTSIVKAFTGSWLFSSIMATSCITVAFCSNMIVSDKITKAVDDFRITPVKTSTMHISYLLSNFITTFIVCFVAFVISLIYLAIVGWYLNFVSILLILANMIITILMGSLLASIIGLFISSQGGLSAICTLVSSMYGFLCGAYMPLSQFSETIRAFVSFIPGTYATVLFRQGYMNGILDKIGESLPPEAIDGIRSGFDGNFSFFGNNVPSWAMFLVLFLSVLLLFSIYILCASLKNKKIKAR